MALSQGPEETAWVILGGFAAAILVWFIYFVKKAVGQPAIDPVTQSFLNGMKEDIERVERAVDVQNTRIRDIELAMARVQK